MKRYYQKSEQILDWIKDNPKKSSKREIAKAFRIKGSMRVELKQVLKELTLKIHLNLYIHQFWTWAIMVLQNTIQILLFLVRDFGTRTANKVKRIRNLF